MFWLVLVLAVMVGGERLLGVPRLAAALVPPGLVATQANETVPQASASKRLNLSDSSPVFSPQVIEPLQAHAPCGGRHESPSQS